MVDRLEAAALSGQLFADPGSLRERSAASPSSPRHQSPIPSYDDSSTRHGQFITSPSMAASAPYAPTSTPATQGPTRGGAQTGPKGVMEDERAAESVAARARVAQACAVRASQEKHTIVAPTVHEEQEQKEAALTAALADGLDLNEGDALERWRRRRMEELRGANGSGALREVNAHGFLGAVERKGWVVVLIYEPDIPRCQSLLAEAVRLARDMPRLSEDLDIVRARATKLAFSLLPEETEDDSTTTLDYGQDDGDGDDDDDVRRADPDVLPTLLAYRNGELEHTWVRVDFELGGDGLEGLLKRENILRDTKNSSQRGEPDSDSCNDDDE